MRVRGKTGFQKHFVFLQHEDTITSKSEEKFELIIGNSHDRSYAFQLMAGIFRLVCTNGMVVGKQFMSKLNRRHIHTSLKEITDQVSEMGQLAEVIQGSIDSMRSRTLKKHEQLTLSDRIMRLRYGERPEVWPITPELLIEPRREVDRGQSLWNTFNVIQENIIKGGQFDRDRVDPVGRGFFATRGITSAIRDIDLNQGMWDIAHSFLN